MHGSPHILPPRQCPVALRQSTRVSNRLSLVSSVLQPGNQNWSQLPVSLLNANFSANPQNLPSGTPCSQMGNFDEVGLMLGNTGPRVGTPARPPGTIPPSRGPEVICGPVSGDGVVRWTDGCDGATPPFAAIIHLMDGYAFILGLFAGTSPLMHRNYGCYGLPW